MINDYDVRKTTIIEKFLLLFKRPVVLYMNDKKLGYTNYKKMFGRTYMLKENVNVKRHIWMVL